MLYPLEFPNTSDCVCFPTHFLVGPAHVPDSAAKVLCFHPHVDGKISAIGFSQNASTMACHPSGVIVDIVGIEASDNGRSCEKHSCCGSVVAPDVAVRFRAVQLPVEGDPTVVESTALAACHVTGGVDACRVGFLRRHLLRCKDEHDGRLAQVTEVCGENSESPGDRAKHHRNKGCCRAVLVEAECRESPGKKPREEEDQGSKSSS